MTPIVLTSSYFLKFILRIAFIFIGIAIITQTPLWADISLFINYYLAYFMTFFFDYQTALFIRDSFIFYTSFRFVKYLLTE